MELHHKLRRDPSWHPSACNICGQMGHQAAQCTTGTINWRQMYGEAAFRIQPTVFQSDIDAVIKARTVDYSKLKEVAKEWATKRQEVLDNPEPEPAEQPEAREAAPAGGEGAEASAPQGVASGGSEAAVPPAGHPPPASDPAAGLPDGWGSTRDGSGKVYYWHKVTKKVQWERPTADTPAA